jgi:hypothetical protein
MHDASQRGILHLPFTGDTSLFQFFGYFGLFCSTVLILRVIVAIMQDGLN